MALWGEPGAMIDSMYTFNTDDLTCYNNYKHNTVHCTFSVYKQHCSYMYRSMVS